MMLGKKANTYALNKNTFSHRLQNLIDGGLRSSSSFAPSAAVRKP